MNFLILTPDGVGSTYLQRALTVYLNSSGVDYYNTHELLNGLKLDDNFNLYKKFTGYNQSLDNICDMLDANQANLVSRVAQYHVENRLSGEAMGLKDLPVHRNMEEDYEPFYRKCKQVFDKIIYCVRDPFEYSLSWGIRNKTHKLNVYSIQERIETHGEDVTYDIDLHYMKNKLHQYNRYQYWVKDNFPDAIAVNYSDIHNNIDSVLSNLTEMDYCIKDDWGISLQEYSVMLYKLSLIYNPNLIYSDNLMAYQQDLINEKKLHSGMPIKMNTLHDKSKKINNFRECLDTYNTFVNSSNQFPTVSHDDILNNIERESEIYKG